MPSRPIHPPAIVPFWLMVTCALAGCLFLLAGGVAVLVWLNWPSPNPPTAKTMEVLHLDLVQLLDDYRTNPVQVAQRLDNKLVEVTGHVVHIDRHGSRHVTMWLAPQMGERGEVPTVLVTFREESLVRQLSDYPLGSVLTVRAGLTDTSSFVHLRASRIIPRPTATGH